LGDAVSMLILIALPSVLGCAPGAHPIVAGIALTVDGAAILIASR
jgi:hypothetical protein